MPKTSGTPDFSQTRTHDLAYTLIEINNSSMHVARDATGALYTSSVNLPSLS
jgi:hypothetical protein